MIHAFVDIDCTLWDFKSALGTALQQYKGKEYLQSQWETADSLKISDQLFCEIVDSIIYKEVDCEPFPWSLEFLKSLKDLNLHVTIISQRLVKYYEVTRKWLKKYGLWDYSDNLICTEKEKSASFKDGLNFIFDDKSAVFEEKTDKRVIKFCVDYSYNKDVQVDYRSKRTVDFLPIVYDIVKKERMDNEKSLNDIL